MFDEDWSRKPDSLSRGRYGFTQVYENFVYDKPSGNSQLPKFKLILSTVFHLNEQSAQVYLLQPCTDVIFLIQRK